MKQTIISAAVVFSLLMSLDVWAGHDHRPPQAKVPDHVNAECTGTKAASESHFLKTLLLIIDHDLYQRSATLSGALLNAAAKLDIPYEERGQGDKYSINASSNDEIINSNIALRSAYAQMLASAGHPLPPSVVPENPDPISPPPPTQPLSIVEQGDVSVQSSAGACLGAIAAADVAVAAYVATCSRGPTAACGAAAAAALSAMSIAVVTCELWMRNFEQEQ